MNPRTALSLRLARAEDAPVLAAMSRELIEAGLEWRYTPQRVAALIGDPVTSAVVACGAQRIEGFAVMSFGDEHAHLVLLCVRPAQHRQGIGRQLMGWLERSAQVAGVATIALELRTDNAGAEAFYRALGFSETQRVPGYYGGGIAARRMERRLAP